MGDSVPSWVERDFRAYLRCGILAHGFARARCSSCGYDFLTAFRLAVLTCAAHHHGDFFACLLGLVHERWQRG